MYSYVSTCLYPVSMFITALYILNNGFARRGAPRAVASCRAFGHTHAPAGTCPEATLRGERGVGRGAMSRHGGEGPVQRDAQLPRAGVYLLVQF